MFKVNGTECTFDLYDAIEHMSPEACATLADALALRIDVIKRVVDHLVDGETPEHSSYWFTDPELSAQRERVLSSQDEVRDEIIRGLKARLESSERELRKTRQNLSAVQDLYLLGAEEGHRFVSRERLHEALYPRET